MSNAKRSKERPSNAPILTTEKDGRLYAITLLEALEEELRVYDDGFSSWSAEAEARGSKASCSAGLILIYRKGKQTDTLRRWIGELYQYGTPEAIAGFYVVFTDFIGSVFSGGINSPDSYVKKELAGELAPWGSVNYSNPKAAARALTKGETAYAAKEANHG